MTNMWDDEEFTVPFATLFAQAGFALVLADYPGMGVNTNVHPYCTESLANCVVDMVRAVRDYLKTNTTDYDGDGKTDPAVYAPGTAYWQVLFSGALETQGCSVIWEAQGACRCQWITTAMDGLILPCFIRTRAYGNYFPTQGCQLVWGLFGAPGYQPALK